MGGELPCGWRCGARLPKANQSRDEAMLQIALSVELIMIESPNETAPIFCSARISIPSFSTWL
jgi:hypothetical protein